MRLNREVPKDYCNITYPGIKEYNYNIIICAIFQIWLYEAKLINNKTFGSKQNIWINFIQELYFEMNNLGAQISVSGKL